MNNKEKEQKERYEAYLREDDLWLAPYIGRKINEHYEEHFDHNGNYPSDDEDKYPEYWEKNLILNLHPHVKDGIVESISYYKKVDNGIYTRHSTYKALTSRDKKIFKELLDECTVSEAGEILDELLGKPLPDGWMVAKVTDKTITLQKELEKISIPRDYVKHVIDVGRSLPDILNNRDFWRVNEKKLRCKYMEGLMVLLSNIEETYPAYIIGETAKDRIAREDAIIEAKASLINAIRNDDKQKVVKCLDLLNVVHSDAINEALKKWDPDLLLKLAGKAAYFSDVCKIGEAAIEKDDSKTLRALVKEKGCQPQWVDACFENKRIEDLKYLLAHSGELKVREECGYDLNELLPLVKYEKVAWTLSYLKEMNALSDKTYIQTALRNIYSGQWGKGYSNSEVKEIITWILSCNDVELLDAVASSGITVDYQNDLFIEIFMNKNDLWDTAKPLFRNYTWKNFFSKFNRRTDYEFLLKLMKYYDVHTSIEDVIDTIQFKGDDKRIAKLIIDRYDESIKPKRPVKPLWEAVTMWADVELFEYFFKRNEQLLKRKDVCDGIVHTLLWYYPDVDKARVLVERYAFSEDLVKKTSLAKKIRLTEVNSETSIAVGKYVGTYTHLDEDDVEFRYVDDKTWEMQGVANVDTGKQIEFLTKYYVAEDDRPKFDIVYIRDK